MDQIIPTNQPAPAVDAFGIKVTDTTAKILVVIAIAYLLQNLGIFDAWAFVKGGFSSETEK